MKANQPRQLRKHFLQKWREHLVITQDRAVERLGWSQSKLSRIENLQIPLTTDDLFAAAEAYGVSAWELLNVDPTKEREVVDAMDLFPQANEEQRRQIADYARFVIEQSKKAG